MPTLIEARLEATRPLQPDTRQLHGLACALFEGGESGGHTGQDKPFAIWPLRPETGTGGLGWAFCASWLPSGPPPMTAVAPAQVRLGSVNCRVAEITHRSVPRTILAASLPLVTAEVAFCSPTYFSQNGTDAVLPDPRLIAGSWRRRWNATLPDGDALRIDEAGWRETHQVLRLASFDLRTQRMDSGRGRDRAGFVGTAVLRLDRGAPAVARSVFGALVRFAEFCGTGAQTTHGFGATRIMVPGA